MTDFEKMELAVRRVLDRLPSGPVADAFLMLVDQMAADEAQRLNSSLTREKP